MKSKINARKRFRKLGVWIVAKKGHVSRHMNLRKTSWTLEGEGDRWWVQWKGSQSYELSPPLDLPFSYFLLSHPWPFSSGPSPFPDVGPFEKWYPLTGSQVQHFFHLLDSGYARLLELSYLISSWFWPVNFAMATAMDCTCWTEEGCMVGTDWRSRWGLLEASLLSWGPGLVTLDLVQTILALCRRKELQNSRKMKFQKF